MHATLSNSIITVNFSKVGLRSTKSRTDPCFDKVETIDCSDKLSTLFVVSVDTPLILSNVRTIDQASMYDAQSMGM